MNLDERIDGYKEDMIRDLRRLIRHDSVKGEAQENAPQGTAVAQCLKDALELGREMGFETHEYDGWAGEIRYGQGDDYVAVLGHLDIVPAGNDWTHDPFAGEIVHGKMFGRGTNDDKGPILAALYALKALKEEGETLGSRVSVVLGTCEETGGPDIEHFLAKNPAPKAGFTPDASFPAINAEKGIVNVVISKKIKPSEIEILNLSGGNAPNMVPDIATLTYRVGEEENETVIKGISAHGSTPEKGDNAILKMLKTLASLDAGLTKDMNFLLESLTDVNGNGMGIGLEDEPSGKLTSNLGLLTFEKGILSVTLNLRIPVTFQLKDVEDPLRLHFADYDLAFSAFTEPLYYPKDLPMISSLMKVYEEVTGNKEEPLAIGGGTYAKHMDNVVAFGPGLPGREDVDHIADEYIFLDDFMTWTKIYARAIKALSNL